MTSAPKRPALILALLATLGFLAEAGAAERKPVLEYVKPGVNVTFVSAMEQIPQDVDGWTFMLDRWSSVTLAKLQEVEARGQRIRLRFENGRMSGYGPCNTLAATYTLEGSAMKIGGIARSKKACATPEAAEVEEEFVRFLERVERMERIDTKLVLHDAAGTRMVFWGAPNAMAESQEDPDGN